MANPNAPFGFKPLRHMSGRAIVQNEYSIASGYASNIGKGHVVEMTGTGKNIQLAAAGNVDSIGVFMGCQYVNAQGEQKFSKMWPASTVATNIKAFVVDDPDVIFAIMCSTLAAADIGQLADWHAGTTNTTTGKSGAYLNAATLAASDASLRILRLANKGKNAYGAYAIAEVLFIEHALRGVVAGVGGQ